MELLDLAQKYARLKQSKILGHRLSEDGSVIIFTLVSGQKNIFTEAELEAAIAKIEVSNGDLAGSISDGNQNPAASTERAKRAQKKSKE